VIDTGADAVILVGVTVAVVPAPALLVVVAPLVAVVVVPVVLVGVTVAAGEDALPATLTSDPPHADKLAMRAQIRVLRSVSFRDERVGPYEGMTRSW
jgi:hypothetical protein